jgi:hypothetical protein
MKGWEDEGVKDKCMGIKGERKKKGKWSKMKDKGRV